MNSTGRKVHLGGNIGTPPLEMLENNIQPEDWVVLELANFQLIDLKYSPKIAVCLMVVPEHLDWHKNEANYYQSKKQLFTHQKPTDFTIYFGKNAVSKEISSNGQAKKIAYMDESGANIVNDQLVIDGKTVCSVKQFQLLGKHNWQNICAAVTAFWQIEQKY